MWGEFIFSWATKNQKKVVDRERSHMLCNTVITVKGLHWRWLIYALLNILVHSNILRVFRSIHHCSWKFHKFHRKTPVLESFLSLKMMKLYEDIFSTCCRNFIDWHHKCLNNTIDLLLFYGEHFYGFSESLTTILSSAVIRFVIILRSYWYSINLLIQFLIKDSFSIGI